MVGNGHDPDWDKPKIDLGDLADRCELASEGEDMEQSTRALLTECAIAFRGMEGLIKTLPEVIQNNRIAQYYETCQTVAGALDDVAMEYDAGKRQHERTPQAALRYFAKSLRESLRLKPQQSKLVI
jgi:hypothetical protein